MLSMYDDICRKVSKLKKKYKTADPYELCESLGIMISEAHFGTSKEAIKGLFKVMNRTGVIILNADLPEYVKKVILAHELGHALLHKDKLLHTFSDISINHQKAETEKEANFFAAELLIDDNELLSMMNDGLSIFESASTLGVPPEIIDYKFKLLHEKGCKFSFTPDNSTTSDFLKKIPVPYNDDNHVC